MDNCLHGSITALVTPFTEDGVNFECLARLIEYQVSGGTDGIVVLGTTGEPCTVTEGEREAIIRFAVRETTGRMKVLIGAGSNDTKRAVSLARQAEELGADGILAVTPYYNKCTQAGLIRYYEAICGAVSLPVYAYSVPSRTGVKILPRTAEALMELPNFAGIKDAGGNMEETLETLKRTRGRCGVFSGEDALNLPILCAGGAGVVSALSNLVPHAVKNLVTAVETGILKEAIAISDVLLPLAKACFCEVNPIPVKAGLTMLGFPVGAPRSPLTPLEPEHAQLLRRELETFGLEVKA